MLWNPGIKWIARNARAYPFTSNRWIRLPYNIHLFRMGTFPNVHRDPTPNPYLSEDDLKAGFFFKEYVH